MERATDRSTMYKKPWGLAAKGMPSAARFIPYAEKIMVGMDSTIVIMASTFMTIFRLLDMMEQVVTETHVYELCCTEDPEAARLSYTVMKGA